MNFFDESTLRKILYTFLAVLIIATLVLFSIYIWYGNKMEIESEEYSLESLETDDVTKEASSTSDKNIQSANTSVNSSISTNVNTNTNSNTNLNNTKNTSVSKIESNVNKTENTSVQSNTKPKENNNETNTVVETPKEEVKTESKKQLDFDAPVDGEILKDFANETLVYSKTLEEWTTHLGIDIKGDKTSIVKSAEEGTVESIKTDPRYGLTITITHQDGYKTVYSNLLTTEFVKEGDKVSKGDTIATIGETASFEVLDEPHLHFEMYKDEMAVNPTLYLK